ncbi:hypothetical protein D3C86_1751980 [compost metagenome]
MAAQNQNFNQNMATDQFAYQKARDAISDQQFQQKFAADTQQFGLNYALNQLQTNSDISYKQAMLALSQSGDALAWAEFNTPKSQTQNTPITAESYATDYLDKAVQKDPDDGSILNKDSIENSILESGLPASEKKKLYIRYGIPLPSGN